MDGPFRLSGPTRDDPGVDAWFDVDPGPLRRLARRWFDRLRLCGSDVRRRLHDGWPTACVEDAAFAYVAAYTAHASIGFFHGATLPDPSGLLQGSGKRMRHVKLVLDRPVDDDALGLLVVRAHADVRSRLAAARRSAEA